MCIKLLLHKTGFVLFDFWDCVFGTWEGVFEIWSLHTWIKFVQSSLFCVFLLKFLRWLEKYLDVKLVALVTNINCACCHLSQLWNVWTVMEAEEHCNIQTFKLNFGKLYPAYSKSIMDCWESTGSPFITKAWDINEMIRCRILEQLIRSRLTWKCSSNGNKPNSEIQPFNCSQKSKYSTWTIVVSGEQVALSGGKCWLSANLPIA